jgi:putative selenium metabolism protein SsnA
MILVGNGTLITHDINNPVVENGALLIDGDKIIEVGKYDELKAKYPTSEFIDAHGKYIMPGFINTHHHIYSTFARGMKSTGNTRNFDEILENLWWKLDKNLTLEDVKYSALATYVDCIKNGVTTVIDHHASPFAVEKSLFKIAEAAEEIGIRASLCYEVSDRDGEEITDLGIKENMDFINYCAEKNSDMLKGLFGLHAAFTLSDETLKKCQKAMEGREEAYHVHTAEGATDLAVSLDKYGKRVVERLDEFGVIRKNTLAVHCIHVNDDELEIIKNRGAFIVHNPESNMGNAVGCSPAIHMLKQGVTVGLGTDGYTSDMLESLKVANILHKHHLADPTVAWSEAPLMLFENNREIVKQHFGCTTGILKPEAKADVIVMDYIPVTPLTGNNYNSHILFGMGGRMVKTTIVDGKVRMKDGVLQGINEEEIFAKSRELAANMWEKM